MRFLLVGVLAFPLIAQDVVVSRSPLSTFLETAGFLSKVLNFVNLPRVLNFVSKTDPN